MFVSVLGILLPVVLLLALGAGLRRVGFFDADFAIKLQKLVFFTSLPCMLAGSISRAESPSGVGAATIVLCGTAVAVCVLGALVARPLGIPPVSIPSFCQTVFRGNDSYVGVPVLALATAGTAMENEVMRVAMLTLVSDSVVCNMVAVFLLSRGSGDSAMSLWRRALILVSSMAKNPLVVGSLAGLALLALRKCAGFTLPEPILKTMSLLGQMATPGALLAVGASISPERFQASFRPVSFAVLFKLVFCPLIGAVAAMALSLPPEHRLVVLVYLACPCSTACYIMDQAMGGDADLSGSAVVLSTSLCAISLAVVLLFCT